LRTGLEQKYPDSIETSGVRLIPLQEAVVGKFDRSNLILMGSAALVLLIACATIAPCFSPAPCRATARKCYSVHEGATRRRIIAQLLLRAYCWRFAGAHSERLLAFSFMGVPGRWGRRKSPRISSPHVDLAVLMFTGLSRCWLESFFGLAPAWQISQGDLNASLKQTGEA